MSIKGKKIKKRDLLETLLAQTKRIEELEIELEKANKKLESRKINISESGSLAEASLKLNKIFEDAQASIDQYIFNLKAKTKKDIEQEKKEIISAAEDYSKKIKKEADEYLEKIKNKKTNSNANSKKMSNKKITINKNTKMKNGKIIRKDK